MNSPHPSTLALFDLDHTLIPIDSDSNFGRYMIAKGWAEEGEFSREIEKFSAQYAAGQLDAQLYTEFAFNHMKKIPLAQRSGVLEDFAREVIAPRINDAARALVQRYQESGAVTVLTSATNNYVTTPIARLFQMPVIGPAPELDDAGDITGKLATPHNMGVNKVSNAKAWLQAQGWHWSKFSEIHAYSDSENDIPLLSVATHPYATNPTAGLTEYANARSWPILWLYPARL